eukprot:jgi/Mesvir1/3714/Mv14995-RA.2
MEALVQWICDGWDYTMSQLDNLLTNNRAAVSDIDAIWQPQLDAFSPEGARRSPPAARKKRKDRFKCWQCGAKTAVPQLWPSSWVDKGDAAHLAEMPGTCMQRTHLAPASMGVASSHPQTSWSPDPLSPVSTRSINSTCPTCLDDFYSGQSVHVAPCGHSVCTLCFHQWCVWQQKHKGGRQATWEEAILASPVAPPNEHTPHPPSLAPPAMHARVEPMDVVTTAVPGNTLPSAASVARTPAQRAHLPRGGQGGGPCPAQRLGTVSTADSRGTWDATHFFPPALHLWGDRDGSMRGRSCRDARTPSGARLACPGNTVCGMSGTAMEGRNDRGQTDTRWYSSGHGRPGSVGCVRNSTASEGGVSGRGRGADSPNGAQSMTSVGGSGLGRGGAAGSIATVSRGLCGGTAPSCGGTSLCGPGPAGCCTGVEAAAVAQGEGGGGNVSHKRASRMAANGGGDGGGDHGAGGISGGRSQEARGMQCASCGQWDCGAHDASKSPHGSIVENSSIHVDGCTRWSWWWAAAARSSYNIWNCGYVDDD